MYYQLGERMEKIQACPKRLDQPYVAVLSQQELEKEGTRMGLNARTVRECGHIRMTKTEVHSQYLFGTLYIPVRREDVYKRQSSSRPRKRTSQRSPRS